MKTRIVTAGEIKKVLPDIDVLSAIERGFAEYSAGRSVVPPVGELLLEKGEVHIKYGYIQREEYYVIKIASGFYENSKLGLSSGNGLMLLFRQETGELVSILLDEGHLTDVRTAVAGAVAAKYLAPRDIERIGIVGTGIQARLQLSYLSGLTTCRRVLVWGRSGEGLGRYKTEMEKQGFRVEITLDPSLILRGCNLVVTTTPSTEPILESGDLQKGTHITAVGSDTPAKQELESTILQKADLVVADSVVQCLVRGEIHQALKRGKLRENDLVELGAIIDGRIPGRTSDSQITVADLTGVAVQDIGIATAVYRKLAGTGDSS